MDDFGLPLPPAKRVARTLSVHDRTINVDSLPPEPSTYLLAREWVANNPHKPIFVRSGALPAGSGMQLPAPLPHTRHSLAKLAPPSRKRGASDVGGAAILTSRASAELILEQHVEHARDVRRWMRVQRQADLDRFRPRLLKLLCGGHGLQQTNMPMPVQPNMPEAQGLLAASPARERPVSGPASAAVALAAEAARATEEVVIAAGAAAVATAAGPGAAPPAVGAPTSGEAG